MGGKPSRGTPADRRLKANQPAPTAKPAKPAKVTKPARPMRRGK